MKRIDKVENALRNMFFDLGRGVSTGEIADKLSIHRANASSDLNDLCRQGKARKGDGRPVLFYPAGVEIVEQFRSTASTTVFDNVIGSDSSLATPIQQAKAAMMYPPFGLHTLIFGETGVGKTMFAELMYQFGKQSGRLSSSAPFVSFNCADYAKNPHLLTGQIFGIAKGAYTGADCNQPGLLEKADTGVLFLDEVHRLPPEGQEMMFTFIDKGKFRRLGEAGDSREARVLIISATTEDPKSALLDTFTRRISMLIHLPPLKERSMEERLNLINEFFHGESLRIKREIGVSCKAMTSFLLYTCKNNIGQLRSDIQLSCARAFLESTANSCGRIYVSNKIIPQDVKRGSFQLKYYRDDVDRLLGDCSEVIYTPTGKKNVLGTRDDYVLPENFYELIEQKIESLRQDGVNEENINEIVSNDIDVHFSRLMSKGRSKIKGIEVENVVGSEIMTVARAVLDLAIQRLDRPELESNLYGLAFHISAIRNRILQGKPIFNPKLNDVRKQYPKEFTLAIEGARQIEKRLKIELPIDEIGYIAMFYLAGPATEENLESSYKVGLLVMMHGHSAASSIADVANALMNTDIAKSIDMPLTTDPQHVYQHAVKAVKELNQGKGVLLMADMGSLLSFGDLLTQETGIPIKTVPMVSTPLVLEAVRKISLGQKLEDIYTAVMEINLYRQDFKRKKAPETSRVIVAACYTGQGSSKIASYLKQNLNLDRINAKIVVIGAVNQEQLRRDIQALEQRVLAVVGTIDPGLPGVPYVRVKDVFAPTGLDRLKNFAERQRVYDQITETLASHLSVKDSKQLVETTKVVLERIYYGLAMEIDSDVLIGAMLHVGCMVERLVKGESAPPFKNLDSFIAKYRKELVLVRRELKVLSEMYDIEISDSEAACIIKMVLGC